MFTASNSLTFIRAPLAFLFLQESPGIRILAILLAMISDSIDGYIARRNQSVTRFGAIFDPLMDKFFVYFAMTVLLLDQKMNTWELTAMLSRDIALFLFGLLLLFTGFWRNIVFQSFRWGKVTTALQFLVLIGLVLGYTIPWYLYLSFVFIGFLAFIELFQIYSLLKKAV